MSDAVKDVIYGGICELMENRKFFYRSGAGLEFSHWTDEGEKALTEFMLLMTTPILRTQHESLEQRAKDIVMKELTSSGSNF